MCLFGNSEIDVEMEDANSQTTKEATPQPEPRDAKADEEPKSISVSKNGRRRGRRQVVKKVTKKDDEGYLGMLLSLIVLIFHKGACGPSMLLGIPEQLTWV